MNEDLTQEQYQTFRNKMKKRGIIILVVGLVIGVFLIGLAINFKNRHDKKNAIIDERIVRLEQEREYYKTAWWESSDAEKQEYFRFLTEKEKEIFDAKNSKELASVGFFVCLPFGIFSIVVGLSVGLMNMFATPNFAEEEDNNIHHEIIE